MKKMPWTIGPNDATSYANTGCKIRWICDVPGCERSGATMNTKSAEYVASAHSASHTDAELASTGYRAHVNYAAEGIRILKEEAIQSLRDAVAAGSGMSECRKQIAAYAELAGLSVRDAYDWVCRAASAELAGPTGNNNPKGTIVEMYVIRWGTPGDFTVVGLAASETEAEALVAAYYEKHGRPTYIMDELWIDSEAVPVGSIATHANGGPVYHQG